MMSTKARQSFQRTIGRALLAALAFTLSPVASETAVAQVLSGGTLDDVKRLYALDQWREAIETADKLIATEGIREGQLAEALAFKGRCLVNLSRLEEAKSAFKRACKIDKSMRPDPDSWTPEETAVFREAGKGGSGKWVIVLAGGAVVGIITLLSGGSDDSGPSDPLPWPPYPPAAPVNGQ